MKKPLWRWSVVTLLALLSLAAIVPRAHAAPLSISVSGNHLIDGGGNAVHLHGVNRSGTEYACIQGFGIFDGPSNLASIQAIASWGANYVRVPLNEDCWLGINGAPAQYSGQNYINAITAFVNLLNSQGMYAELSLIWGAPGTNQATYQPGAPDEDHSPAMWASMAATFKGNPAVILAPWGETIVDANCFLNGGVCEATYGSGNTPYNTAGMQQAVTVMRGAGYTGPIAIPGIDYANDLTGWLSHEPSDPAHQLVAEAHVYGNNTCGAQNGGACLTSTMDPVAAQVPLVLGETGETYDGSECGSANMQTILAWADAHGVGWAAWTWDTWGDCTTLSLISNYNGTVEGGSGYASFVHTHMLSYGGGGGGPTPTPSSTNTPPPNPTATPVPPTPTPQPTGTPSATPTPSPTPPAGGSLTLLQSVTAFIDYAGVNTSYGELNADVGANHLLVAEIAIAGGNNYTVGSVSSELGDTWHKATSGQNGDETDTEIWWTNTAMAGSDGVTATLVRGPGSSSVFVQTLITLSEWSGPGALDGAHAHSSGLHSHDSGTLAAQAGDIVVGLYADAGYTCSLSMGASGMFPLGTKQAPSEAIQGIQAYEVAAGATSSMLFASNRNAYGEVAAAAFRATGGGGGIVQ